MSLCLRLLFIFMLGVSMHAVAQTRGEVFRGLMQKGKAEFKKTEGANYKDAAENFEKAIAMSPGNAEAHYFLAYAYSRMNAPTGEEMDQMDAARVMKCSLELETVIKLEPKYEGEIVILDPYAKLTSEWGSLGMRYWAAGKTDSAKWAFHEGRARGGFSDLILAMNRFVLDQCSANAILLSCGDITTIPIWYLQMIEGYRTDVAVTDLSMLNATWYPRYLSARNLVKFDLPGSILDTMQYGYWQDSVMTIGDFTWTVAPSYMEHYILRGDKVLLSLLRANRFEKDLFFSAPVDPSTLLGLKPFLQPWPLILRFSKDSTGQITGDQYRARLEQLLLLVKGVNKNSHEEMNFIDNIRLGMLAEVDRLVRSGDRDNARRLLKLSDKYVSEQQYPFAQVDFTTYSVNVRALLSR